MYTVMYGIEITRAVLDVLEGFDIDWREEGTWNPVTYNLILFGTATVLMPLFLFNVLNSTRYDIVESGASAILENRFGFKIEK